ncbi:hypothetical protein TWF694_009593 [Orbilia ellipsospora]|uniref:Uncharacterized protein n=1 Tax=Orbilia ellipsospora TaxID=2528407 RepID=A0AAV9XBA0_9PEZI
MMSQPLELDAQILENMKGITLYEVWRAALLRRKSTEPITKKPWLVYLESVGCRYMSQFFTSGMHKTGYTLHKAIIEKLKGPGCRNKNPHFRADIYCITWEDVDLVIQQHNDKPRTEKFQPRSLPQSPEIKAPEIPKVTKSSAPVKKKSISSNIVTLPKLSTVLRTSLVGNPDKKFTLPEQQIQQTIIVDDEVASVGESGDETEDRHDSANREYSISSGPFTPNPLSPSIWSLLSEFPDRKPTPQSSISSDQQLSSFTDHFHRPSKRVRIEESERGSYSPEIVQQTPAIQPEREPRNNHKSTDLLKVHFNSISNTPSEYCSRGVDSPTSTVDQNIQTYTTMVAAPPGFANDVLVELRAIRSLLQQQNNQQQGFTDTVNEVKLTMDKLLQFCSGETA